MILILCGKSGSGKDAILKHLVTDHKFLPIISTTSRPPRFGEMSGCEYYFTSKSEFLKLIDQDLLIEYRKYNTLVDNVPDVWYYGIEKRDFDDRYDYVVILDIKGAKEFIKYAGDNNCVVQYIETSDDVRELRAKNRGSFNKPEWDRRLEADAVDFSEEEIESVSDYIVNNNGLLKYAIDEVIDNFYVYKSVYRE